MNLTKDRRNLRGSFVRVMNIRKEDTIMTDVKKVIEIIDKIIADVDI